MMTHTQMYCGVLIRFVICFCLVGFTYAKCFPEKCGSMEVSYPFWIKNSDCGFPGFQINCTKDRYTGVMAPFLLAYKGSNSSNVTPHYYRILDINYTGHLTINSTSVKAHQCTDSPTLQVFKLPRDGPFYISMLNKFVVIGCKAIGTYAYGKWGEARCISICYPPDPQIDPPYCRYGCCEITLPENWKWINFTGGGLFTIDDSNLCGYSTILDPSTFEVRGNKTDLLWRDIWNADYGLRLNWGISNQSCSMAKATANYSCSNNAECINSPSREGHVCKCLAGYDGNGYSNGTDCTDRDECRGKNLSDCVEEERGGLCLNLPGYYNCSCAEGYMGDGFKNGSGCVSQSSNKTAMFAAIGSVFASVGVSLGVCGLVWWLRKRYQKHASEENFRCNGGFLLQRILAEGQQAEGKIFRIFPENELKKASNNYSHNMKLGGGRSSTVYRGMLSDGTNVAIKKFKEFPIVVETDASRKQFINEIVSLSGLNHKNVVSLVGCCLQTQSPVLVYEFVDGGTVSLQLRSGHLPWQSRLQIAMGTAEALAYLHSELNHRPIIHRDVKSSNILVNNGATPKVANFGLSWILCENDTHLKTNVKDTSGYMDPEYFRKGKLTDKSDVYSFGVFLAELLTGREALSTERPQEEMLLSQFFLTKCKDNCFTGILDPNFTNAENWDQMTAVASLAKECLCPEGNGRPLMVDVKTKLEEIGGSTRLSTTTSDLNVLSNQISSATPPGSTDSLFQLTEMSRIHGR